MEIMINDPEIESYWPISSFRETYQQMAGKNICECLAITEDNGRIDLEAIVVIVRLFIENGERAKNDQKYIVALRFYNFGEMATLDIISQDKSNHRDILKDHATRMNWLSPELSTGADAFMESFKIPAIAVGAHLRVDDSNVVVPFGDSGDFGNNLIGFSANDVAGHIAALCSLGKNNVNGLQFIKALTTFMLQNKERGNFYELFVEYCVASKMSPQNYAGLLMMKVLDRTVREGSNNRLAILVDELTGEFGGSCIVIGAVHNMKMKSN
ncbi:MAG: hypothetical protein WAV73_00025 [Candidatus Moraniibacteriota bacterium]